MNLRLLGSLCLALFLVACGPSDSPEPQGPTLRPVPESPERVHPDTELRDAVRTAMAGSHRLAVQRVRDSQRHPEETLTFLGLERHHRVIEIWPSSGWYTAILAPVLRDRGHLVVANFPARPETGGAGSMGQTLLDKLAENPEVYGQVEVVPFSPPQHTRLGPNESADFVLLSRHFHNLAATGTQGLVLEAIFDALRSGGLLGIIQHRLPEDRNFDPEERTGYLPESFVIEAVQNAGFEFQERSDVNANPLDSADHELGVWTLPPTFRPCEEIEDDLEMADCRVRYDAIGESDRMTLRFVKP